MWGRKVLAP
jgi:hypothetical protein